MANHLKNRNCRDIEGRQKRLGVQCIPLPAVSVMNCPEKVHLALRPNFSPASHAMATSWNIMESDSDAHRWASALQIKDDSRPSHLDPKNLFRARIPDSLGNVASGSDITVLEGCNLLSRNLENSGIGPLYDLGSSNMMPPILVGVQSSSQVSPIEEQTLAHFLEIGASHSFLRSPPFGLVDGLPPNGSFSIGQDVLSCNSRSKTAPPPNSSMKQNEKIPTKACESLLHASAPLAGQLVFDTAMLPKTPRKLRKKTPAELEAFRLLRKSGGACVKHKNARKTVSQNVS